MRIFDLYDIPEEMIRLTGGKAGRLCLLHKAGFPVPPGFVLYKPETEDDFEKAAEYFEDSGLFSVAVRSSAASEDGASFSSAGQYETVLNVSDKTEFRKALQTCLNSLHGRNAENYNAFMRQDPEENYMTVVVQEMVDAKAAGVAFSKDPLDPETALIEACEGLGESLVSGRKQAEQYHVTKDGKVRTKGQLLSEELVQKINDAVQNIAEEFGFTADIEWAVDKAGELWFLQVRPVTTEDLPTVDEFDWKGDLSGHIVTNCNISEMMPGAITPLTMTTSAFGLDYGLRKLLIHSGVYRDEKEIPPYSCYFTINGHLFGDLTPIYAIGKTMVMASKESIDLSICGRILDSALPEDVRSPGFLKRVINFSKYISSVMNKGRACKRAERIASGLRIECADDPLNTYREIDSHMSELMDIMYDHYITSAFSGMMSSALNLQLAPFFEEETEQHAAVASCLVDIPGIESADLLNRMYDLAEAVKKQLPPDAKIDPESVRKVVENGNEETKALYEDFMEKHGHRSICECEMRQKSLKEDPETFYRQLAMVCSAEEKKETAADWKANMQKLLEKVPKSKASTFRMLIKYAREGVRVREYTKSRIVRVTYGFKKAYQTLAEQMVGAGLLHDTDSIFFLTHEEIGRVIKGEAAGMAIKAVRRRRLLPEQQSLKFRDVTCGKPEPIRFDGEALNAEEVLKGTPVSRGIIEGPAHIVRSVEDANNLKPGDIMVAEYTDTGWTPYYSQISGLVTEIGAAISHGAVVAREYGLPLVSNIENATDLIQEGDLLQIDGSAGTVMILATV